MISIAETANGAAIYPRSAPSTKKGIPNDSVLVNSKVAAKNPVIIASKIWTPR